MIKSTIILLLFSYTITYSQNNLKGIITNAENTPLSKTTVFIPELQKVIITDSLGNYELTDLPTSSVIVQYSCIGYKTIAEKVEITGVTTKNISLESGYTLLNEVLITSNNTYQTEKFPISIASVRYTHANHAISLTNDLSYLPGIDKISLGNGISKPVIRGLSFNQIALYTQGTRIENQQWDDHHDLGISELGIENVEIVKGPAALIYGADAIGGALVFIDEKPAANGTSSGSANLGFHSNTLGLTADAGIKSANSKGMFYGLRIGGTSHTSYVQGESEEEIKPNGEEEEFAANSKFMNYAGKFNIGVSKKWGISKLSYSFLDQEIGIVEDEGEATGGILVDEEEEQRERELEAPYQSVVSQIISRENTFFLKNSKLNLNLAYQLNNRKEFEPLPNKQKELAIGLDLNVITYDVKWTSNSAKAFGVTIGSQGTFLENKNNGRESIVPDADGSDVAAYGIVRYDSKRFNLIGGFRFDAKSLEAESFEEGNEMEEDTFIMFQENDTITKPEVEIERDYSPTSFSLGGTFLLNNNLSLKGNIATGFTAPNYAQLGTFGKHEGTFRFERGNVDLKVEQNLEGDLGLVWKGKSFSVDLSAYTNMISDYIYIANTGDSVVRITPDARDTFALYEYRQNGATFTGGEIQIRYFPQSASWLNINLGYSKLEASLKIGGNVPYIPSDKLVGEIKLLKKQLWKFKDTYFSMKISNYEKRVDVAEYELSSDSYSLLDISVGGSFRLFKQQAGISIFCTNLKNEAYFNQLSLVKYIGVRDMGRNIGFNLHVPFGL